VSPRKNYRYFSLQTNCQSGPVCHHGFCLTTSVVNLVWQFGVFYTQCRPACCDVNNCTVAAIAAHALYFAVCVIEDRDSSKTIDLSVELPDGQPQTLKAWSVLYFTDFCFLDDPLLDDYFRAELICCFETVSIVQCVHVCVSLCTLEEEKGLIYQHQYVLHSKPSAFTEPKVRRSNVMVTGLLRSGCTKLS